MLAIGNPGMILKCGLHLWLFRIKLQAQAQPPGHTPQSLHLQAGLCRQPEQGWQLTICARLGDAGVLSVPLSAKWTQPHFMSAWLQSTVKPSHDGSGTSERVKGWAISWAGHLGNHEPPQVGLRRHLGASLERQGIVFPKGPKEQRNPMGAPGGKCSKLKDDRVTDDAHTLVHYPPTHGCPLPAIDQGLEGWEGILTKAQEKEWPHLQPVGESPEITAPGEGKAAWRKQCKP